MKAARLPDGVTLASLRTLPRQFLARECNPDLSLMKPVGRNGFGLRDVLDWLAAKAKGRRARR